MQGHYPNFSYLWDGVVFDNDYGFIVIIDEKISEDLNFVLRQLATQPDIIELRKFTSLKKVWSLISSRSSRKKSRLQCQRG